MFKPVSSKVSFPQMEEEILRFWAEPTHSEVPRPPPGRQGIHLLRRPPLRHRPAALRPPARRHHQGHRPALPDHARPLRRAPLRLGLPRPAHRGPRPGKARPRRRRRHRRRRRRRLQRNLPLHGPHLCRGMAQDRHPHGPLGRLRQRLQDHGRHVHGVHLVGLQAALGPGPRLQIPPHHALLLEAQHPALQLRGRQQLPGRPGPLHHRASSWPPPRPASMPAARPSSPSSGPPPPGPSTATSPSAPGPTSTMSPSATSPTRTSTSSPRPASPPTYKKPEQYERLAAFKGADLLGLAYEPIFPVFAGTENAFRVLNDGFVSTGDGTGFVHMAPAFGEDDFRVCKAAGIPLLDYLDDVCAFTETVPEYHGIFCKDADKPIIRSLKDAGKLVHQSTLVHSYPFCPRTDTPLIYRAIEAWYVRVEDLHDRLVANNATVHWVPAGRRRKALRQLAQGGQGLEHLPQPLLGLLHPRLGLRGRPGHGLRRLHRRTGKTLRPTVTDLHKHHVDKITFPSTARPTAAPPRCSTAGSSPAPCPTPSSTTPSNARPSWTSSSPPTSSPKASTRPAAGSTPSCSSAPRSSTSPPTRTSSSTASSSPRTAARCPSASRTTPTPSTSWTPTAPTPCAST
jgi:hypothetical protein